MRTENKPATKAATFDDDADIIAGADYDGQPSFNVIGGDESYHYFLASKDESDGRPDSVKRVQMMGYEKCVTEQCASASDCELMRIPMKVFEARRKRKRAQRLAAREAQRRPRGIPANALHELGEAGDRPGAQEEWSEE